MNAERAIEILEMLMEGIDPYTGEALPQAFIFKQADVILALCWAVQSLKRETVKQLNPARPGDRIIKSGEQSAGRAWTQEDDRQLKELVASKVPLERLCVILHRRSGGIQKRLTQLGISPNSVTGAARPARLGAHWLYEEDNLLQEMFENGRSLTEMAAALQRSDKGVAYRLQHLQLIDDAEDYLAGGKQGSRYDKEDFKKHFLRGETVPELAERYNLTEKAVQARLFYMGLSRKAPDVFPQRKKEDV